MLVANEMKGGSGYSVLMMSQQSYLSQPVVAIIWCFVKILLKIDFENPWTCLKAFGITGNLFLGRFLELNERKTYFLVALTPKCNCQAG